MEIVMAGNRRHQWKCKARFDEVLSALTKHHFQAMFVLVIV